MPNYANGKIYCIRNRADNDKIVYVGSTTQTLANRMSEHRIDAKRHNDRKLYNLMDVFGVDQFHIELLLDYPCDRREQLHAEEGKYIRLHQTEIDGCNLCIAGRTKKEYYADNVEKLHDKNKAYRDANKDALALSKKAYYDANQTTILDKHREYYNTHKAESAASMKAYREANKEKITAIQKEYYEANKEVLAAKSKTYRDARKDTINAYQARYREENKEAMAVRRKEAYEANKDVRQARQREYYQRKIEREAAQNVETNA